MQSLTYVLQFNRYVNVSALKHYFNVSNSYVLSKLLIVLFPWRHRPWSRQQTRSNDGQGSMEFLPPREDVNSPDMYIPVMAFVTYILLSTLIAGLNGKFEPQLLGITFSNASVIILLELAVLWLGRYILNIQSESQIYDLVAYSGYKFVGVILTIAIAAVVNGGKGTGGTVGWIVFGYTFMANAFFLVSALAMEARTNIKLTIMLATIAEVRSASNRQRSWQPRHADDCPRTALEKDAVPLHLQLRGATGIHVVAQYLEVLWSRLVRSMEYRQKVRLSIRGNGCTVAWSSRPFELSTHPSTHTSARA